MLVHQKDPVETKNRQFQNPKSYVTFSGRLWLYGKDMEIERLRIFERSLGHCEMPIKAVCSVTCQRNIDWETFEAHHEPPKSRGGHDGAMLAVCRRCHVARHNRVTKWSRTEEK